MPDTNAQNTKSQAMRAKAAIHRAMALFTQHWGQMLQLLGEDVCEQNDRGDAWRDFYDEVDGTGHESISNKGEFADNGVQTRLGEIEELGSTLELYFDKWEDFAPTEEQTAAFDEAMLLLGEVELALDEAEEFIRACLPKEEVEAAQETGVEGDERAEVSEPGDGTEADSGHLDDPGTGEG